MKFVTVALTAILMVGLSACSWLGLDDTFRNRSDDYRRAEEMPHIEVPESLDSEVVGELYPIPPGGDVTSYQISEEFDIPRPHSVAVNDSANEVKIQKLADDVWILMSAPPGEAWPRVRSFLTQQAIPTASADATTGVIETGLFELSDEPGILHQFLITLTQGVQIQTTEIEILHRQYARDLVPEQLLAWASKSVNVERENWLRDNLAGQLASEDITGTASLLGRDIGAAEKVILVTPPKESPYIDMRLDFLRAWASVGYALDNGGFSVVESVQKTGYFVTQYVEPLLEERSFFQKLFGTGKPKPVSYRVVLETKTTGIHVQVYLENGSEMNQRDTYLVLEKIRSNLG